MDPLLWIVLGCFVWMVIGLFVLGIASKKYRHGDLFPAFGFVGGPDIFALPILVLWLFLWPVHLLLAPHIQRFNQRLAHPSREAASQLGLIFKLAPGARGVTKTSLQPSGKIEVNGRLYDAQSQQGHLAPDTPIEVVGNWMNRPVVKSLHTSV